MLDETDPVSRIRLVFVDESLVRNPTHDALLVVVSTTKYKPIVSSDTLHLFHRPQFGKNVVPFGFVCYYIRISIF